VVAPGHPEHNKFKEQFAKIETESAFVSYPTLV